MSRCGREDAESLGEDGAVADSEFRSFGVSELLFLVRTERGSPTTRIENEEEEEKEEEEEEEEEEDENEEDD